MKTSYFYFRRCIWDTIFSESISDMEKKTRRSYIINLFLDISNLYTQICIFLRVSYSELYTYSSDSENVQNNFEIPKINYYYPK